LRKFIESPPLFRDEKTFLPLQAADLYAWQLRNYFDQNKNPNILVPVNKILGQFVDIPMIERPYDEAELARLNKHLTGIGDVLAAQNPHVPLVAISDERGRRKADRKRAKKGAPASSLKKPRH
jgi:hypothetical protein